MNWIISTSSSVESPRASIIGVGSQHVPLRNILSPFLDIGCRFFCRDKLRGISGFPVIHGIHSRLRILTWFPRSVAPGNFNVQPCPGATDLRAQVRDSFWRGGLVIVGSKSRIFGNQLDYSVADIRKSCGPGRVDQQRRFRELGGPLVWVHSGLVISRFPWVYTHGYYWIAPLGRQRRSPCN